MNSIRLFFVIALLSFLSCKQDKPETTTTSQPVDFQRFELLPSSQTGITFKNVVKEQSNVNYFTANYLYIGGGIGVADFNLDGLTDLYFVAVTGENKLYFNQGDFKFQDVTAQAGVGLDQGVKTGVSIVDINSDGYPDIFQCRTGQTAAERGNVLFVNQRNGTFLEQASAYGLNTAYPSTEANFFDYDLDGDLDMYLINRPEDFETNSKLLIKEVNGRLTRVNQPSEPVETDRLFRNDGNRFIEVSKGAGINNRAFSLSVNIHDFNEDGYPDIYVANDYVEPDHIYINQGNGKFVDEWDKYLRHQSHFSMGADIADLNNDGRMEIVTLDMLPVTNYRQKQNGTVMKYDRYTSLANYNYGHQIMRNMLQVDNGNGGFNEVACLAGMAATDWGWAPLLADFDNDGMKDLFITNGMKKDVNDKDFANYTLDSLRGAGTDVSDFSKLVHLIPSEKIRNHFYRNNGSLILDDVSDAWGFDQKTFSNGAAYVDLDNDGDLDLVIHNTDDESFVYKNMSREKGQGNFLQVKLTGPRGNTTGQGARLRLTAGGKTQILEKQANRGFLSSFEQPLHFGIGSAQKIERLEIIWPDRKMQVIENTPINKVLEINYTDANQTWTPKEKANTPIRNVTVPSGINYIHNENLFEDFERERLIHRKYSARGPALEVFDINGDGTEDFFIGGTFFKKGTTIFQGPDGKFVEIPQPAFEQESPREDVDAVFFDANGDTAPDLYIVSGGTQAPLGKGYYTDRLFLNNRKGALVPQPINVPDEAGSCVKAFDFDRDGDMDLAIGGSVKPGEYPRASKSFLLKNTGGQFSDATAEWAPAFADLGIVNDIQMADLDGNSVYEMIVVGEWMNVTVFEVGQGKWTDVTEKFGLQNTEGWWHAVQVADFNGDGHLDIAAGNLSLNCRLTASPSEPIELFATDIDQNGQLDPLLTYYNEGKRHPVVHRDALIKQVPGMKKTFTRYKPYSNATLEKVLNADMQKQAIYKKAGTLANSIFWGSASGKFTRVDMPAAAQTSPIMDMCLRDMNGDGLMDIIAVGNDYGLEIESGRLDAGDGWIILGSKDKNLRVVPNSESGFYASREGRGVKIINHKASGSSFILVGNTNGPVEAHEIKGQVK